MGFHRNLRVAYCMRWRVRRTFPQILNWRAIHVCVDFHFRFKISRPKMRILPKMVSCQSYMVLWNCAFLNKHEIMLVGRISEAL